MWAHEAIVSPIIDNRADLLMSPPVPPAPATPVTAMGRFSPCHIEEAFSMVIAPWPDNALANLGQSSKDGGELDAQSRTGFPRIRQFHVRRPNG
jgi:hypothetical protein